LLLGCLLVLEEDRHGGGALLGTPVLVASVPYASPTSAMIRSQPAM
jgi:hypothetical protein